MDRDCFSYSVGWVYYKLQCMWFLWAAVSIYVGNLPMYMNAITLAGIDGLEFV